MDNLMDLVKELRTITSAGLQDCKRALEEASGDVQKAVDIIKAKGQLIADGRASKIASEGKVNASHLMGDKCTLMVEVNCQTDFVANSPEFRQFTLQVLGTMAIYQDIGSPFKHDDLDLEKARQELVSKTKENIVIRRWWVQEVANNDSANFVYIHTNGKIGVVLSLQAPSMEAAKSQEFSTLGNDLAMQIAALNPMAISIDRLAPDDSIRQRTIFETQLRDLNKPAAAWPKILEGKVRKWYTEVVLLEQESVIVPKTSVKDLLTTIGNKLGGEIKILDFIRCQVGEGIEVKKEDLAEEVAKLM